MKEPQERRRYLPWPHKPARKRRSGTSDVELHKFHKVNAKLNISSADFFQKNLFVAKDLRENQHSGVRPTMENSFPCG